ncbi:MAG: PAS domain-containing protein [Nitrospirae bacterium]|nr:PAS domain-containing protein [Nitrospirota bacterium]
MKPDVHAILKDGEFNLNFFFDDLPNPFFVIDEGLLIVYCNKAFGRFFDLRLEEVLGCTVFDIFPDWYGTCISGVLTEALKDKKPAVCNHFICNYGHKHVFEAKFYPFSSGLCAFITDMAGLDRLQELQEHMDITINEEIDKRLARECLNAEFFREHSTMVLMGEMFRSISHQWRQPLNALGLIIQDLKEAYDFGELNYDYLEEAVKKAMLEIHSMSGTLDVFGNFFNPVEKKSDFNVVGSIGETLFITSSIFLKESITVGLNFDPKEAIIVSGYSNEFKQAILNILMNCVDAIVDKRTRYSLSRQAVGKIWIERQVESGKVHIKIGDDGGGMPEDMPDRRSGCFTTKDIGNITGMGMGKRTGMGLYLSRLIIENNMGGQFSAENYNGGTITTITLKTVAG